MQKELTCEQVGAIITFYIEGKLSETLQKAVKHHLDICPECSAKFDAIMNMLKRGVQDKISENSDNEAQNKIKNKQYAEFKANLSAYIDNELDDRENIRIKKITISNPMARKDLEEMYAFKKLLHNSFDKTRTDLRYDFSKNVLNQMHHTNATKFEISFKKLAIAYIIMLAVIIAGAIHLWLSYF